MFIRGYFEKIHDRKRRYFIPTTIRHMRNEDYQALAINRLVYKNTLSYSTCGLLNLVVTYIYIILIHKYVSVGIFQRMKRRGGPVTVCSLPVLKPFINVCKYVLETEQESFAHYSSSAFYIISLSLSSCKQTSFHVIIY